jgi:heparosan-N-sulfate-glucuronate 5-epimerase
VRYLPSRIAAYALAHWNQWLIGGHLVNRAEFVRAANWMLLSPRNGRYEHDIAVAGISPPWISCIAQGEAASVLTRAHMLTGDNRYLRAADDAVRWLLVSEEDGGLQSRLPDGGVFLEEYPGSIYRHVLNGCLYAAVGVSDLSRVHNQENNDIRLFLRTLCLSIGSHLALWDVSGWSTYDYPSDKAKRRNLNTMTYHMLQIILLEYLADVTGDDSMRAMSERWAQSSRSLRARISALMAKARYRLAVRW